MIFALTNSKGGVGKTTLAVHLAAWLREHAATVALVDADVQNASSVWIREAEPEIGLFRLHTPDDVLEQVPDLAARFTHVVIDGPAGLSEVTRAILLVTALAVLPCGPSILDVRAANEAIRVLRQAQQIRQGNPQAVLVPNKVQARTRLGRDLIDTVRGLDVRPLPGLHLRQAYAEAASQGTVVWRLGKHAQPASIEVLALLSEVYESATKSERSSANQPAPG